MSTFLDSLIVVLFYIIGIAGAIHALLRAREPRSALIWMAICLFVPLFGTLLYAIFGVNRVKKVTQNWHSHGFSSLLNVSLVDDNQRTQSKNHPAHKAEIPKQYADWIRSGDHLLRTPIQAGCEVTPLFDNKETYQAMIDAVHAAKENVFLTTYIFSSKGLGEELIKALAAAVERKVEVKVLIDGLGDLYSHPSVYRILKKQHVPTRLFLSPFHSLRGILFLNLRNHAKIMTVDGKLGFTGGMNIRDEGEMYDLHFRCEGPIVGSLQDIFLNLWYFAAHEREHPRVIFYDDTPKGGALVRGIDNGPYQDFPHIVLRLVEGLNRAKNHIRIMTPYFVIGTFLIGALINARLRGVDVQIILPEENNLSFVKGATEAGLAMLLRYGIKFYYRQGAFAHSKVVVIDDDYVFLGSSNLDTRSFLLNFEFNLEVYDPKLAATLIHHFEEIEKISRRITMHWLTHRNVLIKLRNAVCKLFAPYL